MRLLLDTHFLIWILTDADRLAAFEWLEDWRPWGISPVTLLELQFLSETGRLELDGAGLLKALQDDPRFVLDEPPLVPLVERALGLVEPLR